MSSKEWPYDTEVEGKKIVGQFEKERIVTVKIERISHETIKKLYTIPDITCFASDMLDSMGISGAVPASVLKPLKTGQKVIGHAITLRNAPFRGNLVGGYRDKPPLGMADRDLAYLGETGDVIVIEGVHNYSNIGDLSVLTSKTQGIAGIVLDGAMRDVATILEMDFPMWVRELTPITGKYRTTSLAINSEITVDGVQVHPGDLVFADDSGVVFVPIDKVEEMLEVAKRQERIEEKMREAIRNHSLEDIRKLFTQRYIGEKK
jgi:regulator of RNase E activity RraA